MTLVFIGIILVEFYLRPLIIWSLGRFLFVFGSSFWWYFKFLQLISWLDNLFALMRNMFYVNYNIHVKDFGTKISSYIFFLFTASNLSGGSFHRPMSSVLQLVFLCKFSHFFNYDVSGFNETLHQTFHIYL